MSKAEGVLPIIIAPTFNNERTLGDIVQRIRATGLPLIVVNDGSTDRTATILQKAAEHDPDIQVLMHSHNMGKAAAMQTGFARAAELNHTHAITIDTDNQHDPEEIPLLLKAAKEYPNDLIIGARRSDLANTPWKNRFGRRFSNWLVRIETGRQISDSQSGFRVYPLELVKAVPCHSQRYNFETEIIARGARAGFGITEVPITSRYLSANERVTHFRLIRDSIRSVMLHLRLLCRCGKPAKSK